MKDWLFPLFLIGVLVVVLYGCYLSQFGAVVFRVYL